MAKKLNITIQGRQVWIHNDCHRAGMNYWVWSGPNEYPGSQLVNNGWDDSHDPTQQGMFATEIEAAIYAVKQADPVESPYKSWLVPYMVSDQFVFLNNDRMRLDGLCPGISEPLYLANGPVGLWTHRLMPEGEWFAGNSNWFTEREWNSLNHVFSVNRGRCLPTFLESQLIPVGAPMTTLPETARQTLEKKLGPELVRLMGLDPLPPDIRGHILAKTHCWVPDEVTDLWAYLLEWKPPVAEVPVAKPQATPLTTVRSFNLEASRSQTVYGRASYSATEYQSTSGRLTAEEIASIIDGAADRDDAERLLREHVMEWDYDCDSTEYYNYEDEEVVDYGDIDNEDDNISRVLGQFFENHPEHDPEREDEEEESEEPADALPFRLGQRVRVTGVESCITFTGQLGTVRGYNADYDTPASNHQCWAVQFDERFSELLHDCSMQHTTDSLNRSGYWVSARTMQAVTE